jgi:hypothetical protein
MLQDIMRMPHLHQCNPVMRGPITRCWPGALDVIGCFVNVVYGQAAGSGRHFSIVANCLPVFDKEPLSRAKYRGSDTVNLRKMNVGAFLQSRVNDSMYMLH